MLILFRLDWKARTELRERMPEISGRDQAPRCTLQLHELARGRSVLAEVSMQGVFCAGHDCTTVARMRFDEERIGNVFG